MLIRPIVDADIPAAASLLRRAALAFVLPEATPEGAAAFLASHDEAGLRRRIAEGYVYHVALADGDLAGFIGLRGRTHVYHLFVDRRWHRRGVGRRLWEAARAAAIAPGDGAGGAADGAHPGMFTVNSSNHALRFYAALGFEPDGPAQGGALPYNPMRRAVRLPVSAPASGLGGAA